MALADIYSEHDPIDRQFFRLENLAQDDPMAATIAVDAEYARQEQLPEFDDILEDDELIIRMQARRFSDDKNGAALRAIGDLNEGRVLAADLDDEYPHPEDPNWQKARAFYEAGQGAAWSDIRVIRNRHKLYMRVLRTALQADPDRYLTIREARDQVARDEIRRIMREW